MTEPTSHKSEPLMEVLIDHDVDRQGHTVNEIKCGELHFSVCDKEDVFEHGSIEAAQRERELKLFKLTRESFQQYNQVYHVHTHAHLSTHTNMLTHSPAHTHSDVSKFVLYSHVMLIQAHLHCINRAKLKTATAFQTLRKSTTT